MVKLITANWLAPTNVHSCSTTRIGGVSQGVYQGLNLGAHVSDNMQHVAQNRELLSEQLHLRLLTYLNQTHSCTLLKIDDKPLMCVDGDAIWTTQKNQPCVVMTADCLPLLLTDIEGTFVAAIHAGWRGLADGIIEKSITTICNDLNISPRSLLVWLGPCIGKQAFAVGGEVRAEFMQHNRAAKSAFSVYQGSYLADLKQLAKLRLAPFAVSQISSSDHCTFNDEKQFYSYRRDGKTGRMASLIWLS